MAAKQTCAAILLVVLFCGFSFAQDLKGEEIVAKHLDSIGTKAKRDEMKNMMVLGSSEFESKLPERKSAGKVALVSESGSLLFIASFAATSYPYEKIGFFDGKVNVPFITSGIRSPLGDFLWEHPSILKGGLFGGSLSTSWCLLDGKFRKAKLNAAGQKKINGRNAYVVSYFPPGNSESLKIQLFFDAATFQHIRTTYREEYAGKEAKFGTLGQASGYVMELTEDFKDFQTSENMTLPGTFKVKYLVNSSKGTFEYDWAFTVNDVKFNQSLKEGFFNFN